MNFNSILLQLVNRNPLISVDTGLQPQSLPYFAVTAHFAQIYTSRFFDFRHIFKSFPKYLKKVCVPEPTWQQSKDSSKGNGDRVLFFNKNNPTEISQKKTVSGCKS